MLKLLSHDTPDIAADNHVVQAKNASLRISWTESTECAPYFAQEIQLAQRIWPDSKKCAPYFAQFDVTESVLLTSLQSLALSILRIPKKK